jgi:hypothetical protein
MGGHGCRPVHEGAKGIVWAATLSDNGPSGGGSDTFIIIILALFL